MDTSEAITLLPGGSIFFYGHRDSFIVTSHLFRHSNAIYRLRVAGEPKSLQRHLVHSDMAMTMRYLSTLQEDDSIRIERQVDFRR